MCTVFFFKQKTAYEMRISDWSSDVCSSDLSWRQFVGYRRWRRCGAAGFAGICESQRFEAACAHPVGRDGGRLPRTKAQGAGAGSPQGAEVGGNAVGRPRLFENKRGVRGGPVEFNVELKIAYAKGEVHGRAKERRGSWEGKRSGG